MGKLERLEEVAEEDDLVTTGRGGVQVDWVARPRTGPRAWARVIKGYSIKYRRAAVMVLGQMVGTNGRVAWHARWLEVGEGLGRWRES